ncbi:hypothetical protein PoB_001743400 [Plakobranchus ocellatus]|uniref:Uncharacterized protein n=1 Tax=Plakobranchus ocellatus TaxID=259542 RepID=A0AAV3Z6I0_9GAST|nr:hypothetical protein PoB_001743400 [Plakobranchus ocellatus]
MPITHLTTIRTHPLPGDFNSQALASELQLLETLEQPTISSRADPSMQQAASSVDCPSQGTMSKGSSTLETSSVIPSKSTLKTQIKKVAHDLKAKNYDGLTE